MDYASKLLCAEYMGAKVYYLTEAQLAAVFSDDDNFNAIPEGGRSGFYFRHNDEPKDRMPYGPYPCIAEAMLSIEADNK